MFLDRSWPIRGGAADIYDCSPIPVFFIFVPQTPDCYTHQKKRGRISPSMEWRYLCYLQLVSKAKHSLTPMAKEEVCPRDEIADPPGMNSRLCELRIDYLIEDG